MSVIKNMLAYLRRPYLTEESEDFTPKAFGDMLKLLALAFLTLPILGALVTGLFTATGTPLPEPSEGFDQMVQGGSFIVIAAIIAPLVEEGLFRSWLGKTWGILLVAPILVVLVALLAAAGSTDVPAGLRGLLPLIVLVAFGLYFSRYLQTKDDPAAHARAAQVVFPYAFWGTSIAFGLLHLGNYAGSEMQLLTPLIVLPQFVIGVILGYVRMRYGLISAILFHSAYNTVLVTLFALASAGTALGTG